MYNYNNTINTAANNTNKNNNKMEEIKMNEIKMASILNKLDRSGVKVGFSDQIPAQLAHSDKPYMTGYMTGTVPANVPSNMFAQGAVGGIGLVIEGEKETPELMELVSYLSRNAYEGAALIKFCQKCLLAGNVPVRKVVDVVDEDCGEEYADNSVYFICSNGKVLIRNGEDFEIVYEGTVLPNLQTMSDKQCLDVIRSTVETYANLVEQGRDENNEQDSADDLWDRACNIAVSRSTPEELEWVYNVIVDIKKARGNDDIIREQALTEAIMNWVEAKCLNTDWTITNQMKQIEALQDWIEALQDWIDEFKKDQKKEEPECGEEDDGQQNWIF